jgi:hypothetical protein
MIEIRYTRHALSRMFERGIELSEVEAADRDTTIRYIITVYRPDPLDWDESLSKRKERP